MSIGVVSDWITVVGGALALIAVFYPKIRNWAIRRGVLYWHWKLCLAQESRLETIIAGSNRLKRAWWYWWQKATFKTIKYLVPMHDYVLIVPYYEAVAEELQNNSRGVLYSPSVASDPYVRELAVFVDACELDVFERNYVNRHKGVLCANECGTRYGERRSDHDFLCDAGVNLSGGWFCPSEDDDDLGWSCMPKSRGAHYCGMCLKELGMIDPPVARPMLSDRF